MRAGGGSSRTLSTESGMPGRASTPPVGKAGHAPGLRRRADRTAHRGGFAGRALPRLLRIGVSGGTLGLPLDIPTHPPRRPPDPGQVTASAAPGALPVPIRQRVSGRRGARRRRGAHGNHRHHRGLRGPGCAGPHRLRRRPGAGAGARVSLRQARIPARHAAGAADGLRAAGGALPRRRSMRELSTQLRMRSAIGKSTGAMPVPGRARLAAVRRRPSPTPERDLRQFRRDAPVAMLRCASR